MANGTNRGGKQRSEGVDRKTAKYECPICGEMNTRRKSVLVRGARFCKAHGNESNILYVVEARKRLFRSRAAG